MSTTLDVAKSDSTTTTDTTAKPRNVSSSLWERFQAIRKRTDDATKRSTEKRIQRLKTSVLDKVQGELRTTEEKDILKKHNVVFEPSPVDKSIVEGKGNEIKLESKRKESDEQLNEVNKYMGINDHLLKADWTRQYTKSGLEKQIDEAVVSGDVTTAEKLSDQLATRNYGVKMSEAFQAQEYLKRKKEEEESIKARKKKKLSWGFEQKHKWETKGNM